MQYHTGIRLLCVAQNPANGFPARLLDPLLLLARVLLEHETGESAQGEVYLVRLVEAMDRAGSDQIFASVRMSMAITAVARITGVPDRLEIAEAAAEAVLSDQSITPVVAMYAKAGLALLAARKGDQSAAQEQYAYLLEQRATMIWTVSSVDRLLGLLSQTVGDLDQAVTHFEEGLAFCRKAGYRPELAWTCCDYADALAERDGEGDRAKAVTLLEESLAISTYLEMRPLTERAKERMERMDRIRAQPDTAPAYPDALTPREVEVLRLIAAGNTDREIAQKLITGVRTVYTHVSNILHKTNSSNRAEATAYAFRNGLV